MEQRKLIKLGNSSFAIALPKDWVNKAGLKKGDNIFITPNSNGELIIQPKYQKINGTKEIILNLEGKNQKEISRELVAAYVNGNTLFRINISDSKNRDYVKKTLKDFPSIEIMEQKDNILTVKDLIDIETISVSSVVRRLDNTIRSMLEDLEPCINRGYATAKQYNELFEADKDVNRFYFLLWKIMILGLENPSVINTLQTNYSSLVNIWWVGVNLERIGDNIKRIARALSQNKIPEKDAKKIESFYKEIKQDYIDALNCFHKKDKESAMNLSSRRDDFDKRIESFCQTKEKTVHQICDKMKNIENNLHYISKCLVYFIK